MNLKKRTVTLSRSSWSRGDEFFPTSGNVMVANELANEIGGTTTASNTGEIDTFHALVE